jgi:hypothetical protein
MKALGTVLACFFLCG